MLLTLFSPTPFMWVWPRMGRGLDTGAEAMKQMFEQSEESRATSMCTARDILTIVQRYTDLILGQIQYIE